MSAVYVIKLRVESDIIVSDASQLIKSFAEVAYLVSFIVGVVHKGNLKFLVGGRFQ